MADEHLAIMIAWIEEGVEIVRERRRDLGEMPITRPIKIARCAAWLYDGDRADLAKAIAYAKTEPGHVVYSYPATVDNPKKMAMRDIIAGKPGAGESKRPVSKRRKGL